MGKKDSKMEKLCPTGINPENPLDVIKLVRTLVNQSNEIFDHKQPEVAEKLPHAQYIERAKLLQDNLDYTMDCLASGKAFRQEFLDTLYVQLSQGVPRERGTQLKKQIQKELESMSQDPSINQEFYAEGE
jgi:hypothetical protein